MCSSQLVRSSVLELLDCVLFTFIEFKDDDNRQIFQNVELLDDLHMHISYLVEIMRFVWMGLFSFCQNLKGLGMSLRSVKERQYSGERDLYILIFFSLQ